MFNLLNRTIMTKTYIDAKLQIVRANDDIITSSITIGNPITGGQTVTADAPGRRSIWD
jgi:hypothetical protein